MKRIDPIDDKTELKAKSLPLCAQDEDDALSGALVEEEDYYFNADGNWVFTAAYHLKRGYCCKSGCRHCPFGFTSPKFENESK